MMQNQMTYGDAGLAAPHEVRSALGGRSAAPSPPLFEISAVSFDEGIILGRLGHLVNGNASKIGEKLRYQGERHVIVFGPNGSGKGTRLLVPNLLQSVGRSIFVIDPKGELAAITALHRRNLGRVVIINPFGILTDRVGFEDMRSEGFNPLAALDPSLPSFNVQASLLADAMITVGGNNPHWDVSARSLVAALIMFTVLEARGRSRAVRHRR